MRHLMLILLVVGLLLAVAMPRPAPRTTTQEMKASRLAPPASAPAPSGQVSGRHAAPRVLAHTRAGRPEAGAPQGAWRDFDALAEAPGPAQGKLADASAKLCSYERAKPGAPASSRGLRDAPWSTETLLADATQMDDQHLALQVNPATDHLFAVWEAYDLGGTDRDIHIARSLDDGVTWQQWEMPSFSLDEAMPDLAIDAAGYLHVTWIRDDGVVLRARSAGPENCQSWAWVRGLNVGEPVVTPSITVRGSGDFATVFIACGWLTVNWDWYQYEYTLLWMWSTNGGATVSYDYIPPDGYQDYWPDAAFAGTAIVMLNGEADPETGRIRILAAVDAPSGSFADYVDLSETTPMSCGFPSVACDGANVYMVYQLDWDSGVGGVDGDVMYCFSWDGLATVYGPYELMATLSESVGPTVYTRGGIVGCVWLEAPPNGDEFDLAARQAGLNGHPDGWGTMETITTQPRVEPRFRSCAGAVGAGRLHAAWIDRRDYTTEGFNVYTSSRTLAPDLEPFALEGWESPLIVSMVEGERQDGILAAGYPTYVSFGLANMGLAIAVGLVQAELRLDDVVVGTWQVDGGLGVATYVAVEDWPLAIPAGAHTLTLRLDPTNAIAESDEDDNVLTKDLWVVSGEPVLELSQTSLRFEVAAPTALVLPLRRDVPATRLDPRLVGRLGSASSREGLRVIVVPAQRVDAAALERALAGVDPAPGRRAAIDALVDRSRTWSEQLYGALAGERAGGEILGWEPLWLSQEIAVLATPAGVAALAARPEIGSLWLDDQLNQPFFTPADPEERTLWHQTLVGADDAWALGFDGAGVLVGQTDTGVAWDHPDLVGRLWDGGAAFPHHGWDCLDEDDDPYDGDTTYWHGTHTAGLVVGAQSGTAPGARVLVTRCVPGYYADLVQAIQFSLDHGCQLITTSAGWTQPGAALRAANRNNAELMLAVDIPWFVAGGNGDNYGGHLSPPNDISSPGDCPDPWYGAAGHSAVIAIGALTSSQQVWSSSSRGPVGWTLTDQGYADYPYPPGLIKPDLAAPGASVTSTVGGGGYATYSGTSMATPIAAGCAAILLQASPGLTPAELAEVLETTTIDLAAVGRDNDTGAGLIDVPAALQAAPATAAQSVWARNLGPVPLLISQVSWSMPWLALAPTSGTVAPGDSLRFTVSVDATGLAAGGHHDLVSILSNDAGSPAALPVTLAVGGAGQTATPDVPAGPAVAVTCWPNPFNPRTTVAFSLPSAGRAALRLYDTRGRLQRNLATGVFAAGRHTVEWDGRDDGGRECPSGVYLLRFERAGAAPVSGKAMLVR
jgi:subtilisin family serine protease